jgi:predicted transcriptional regulator
MEAFVPKLITVAVRLPPDLIERLDALAQALQNDPRWSRHGQVNRSILIREVMANWAGRQKRTPEVRQYDD